MYGLSVKRTYIDFKKSRQEKPPIQFFGFNRNVMMHDIRYDKKDKLTQLFNEILYDLDELYEVSVFTTN